MLTHVFSFREYLIQNNLFGILLSFCELFPFICFCDVLFFMYVLPRVHDIPLEEIAFEANMDSLRGIFIYLFIINIKLF